MPGRSSRLVQSVLSNKGTKLVSVALAVVVWYVIHEATSKEAPVAGVPLRILVDEGWAVMERSANTVDVLFRGSQADLLALNPELVEVEVDLRGADAPSSVVDLLPRHVKTLGGARAVHLRPNRVTLTLDQEGEKRVPVKPVIQGQPPDGFEMEKVVAEPVSVLLYGPRRRMAEIERVNTAPLDLGGRQQSFKRRVPVVPPSDVWVATRMEPSSVEVQVTLVERSATREMNGLRVNALVAPGGPPRVTLLPGKVDVVLKGRSELIDPLSNGDVQLYVDCAGLEPAVQYDLPVRAHTPPGVAVESMDPPIVQVEMNE